LSPIFTPVMYQCRTRYCGVLGPASGVKILRDVFL